MHLADTLQKLCFLKNTKFNRCHFDQNMFEKNFLEAKIMHGKRALFFCLIFGFLELILGALVAPGVQSGQLWARKWTHESIKPR